MIGQTIHHYRIIEKLGQGGMGVVYRARDEKLNRDVALKFLPDSAAKSRESSKRFVLEAQAAASLTHDRIATIYEVNENEGQPFIAMELVEGRELAELIERNELSLDEKLRIIQQICEGLSEAHAKGVVHRDVKPANIMITHNGNVKIMDFGLAKMSDATQITQAGATLGTPAYMSPEQAQGREVDHQSDIWAVGVLMYELLTGARPFVGENTAACVYAIINSKQPPLRSEDPSLPAYLEKTVERALAKEKKKRYQQLGDLLNDLGLSAGSLKTVTHIRSESSSSGLALPVAIAAALVILVGAVYWYTSKSGASDTVESVAVLPLEFADSDSTSEYLASGLSEALISSLSKAPNLKVMSWYATLRFKGKDLNPIEVGERLDVQAIFAGRLQSQGEKLKVSLELINVNDARQLWGNQFETGVEDIVAMQERIATEIASFLGNQLSTEETRRVTEHVTENSEAYRLYLQGRFFWHKFGYDNTIKAIEYFKQAIEIDPTFALAYTGLADCHMMLAQFGSVEENVANARAYVSEALRLDDSLPEAHVTLADILYSYDWKWDEAEAELEKALALNPNLPFAYKNYGDWAMNRGRPQEAVAYYEKAINLDPLSHYLNCGFGGTLIGAEQYDDAIAQAKRTLNLETTCPFEHMVMGMGYVGKHMHEEGLAEINKAVEEAGEGPRSAMALARAHCAAGDTARCDEYKIELLTYAQEGRLDPYSAAQVYALNEMNTEALDNLERALAQRLPSMPSVLVDDAFENLVDEPRFAAILKEMGLTKPAATN